MARFYPLTVTHVEQDTRDAVIVTLQPRAEDRARFDFIQGQYLTLRHNFDGEEVRRSYSICAGRDEGVLRVGIKRVKDGLFSSWANDGLTPGEQIEAMPPMGCFFSEIEPEAAKHYLAFAAGSGITPLLSIIATTLAREPRSRFTLVYANRQISSIMFRERLEDLKNIHLGRLAVIHVLKADSQDIDLFTGRIDAEKIDALFAHWIDPQTIDTAFICGPQELMLIIASALRRHGFDDARIKFELFASHATVRTTGAASGESHDAGSDKVSAIITLDGASRTISFARDGPSILDAALSAHIDVPYACKAGICSTCRCRVLAGEVEMAVNHALEDYEVKAGYVLSCQAHALSDHVVISYDE